MKVLRLVIAFLITLIISHSVLVTCHREHASLVVYRHNNFTNLMMLDEISKVNNLVEITGYSFGSSNVEGTCTLGKTAYMKTKNITLSSLVVRLNQINDTSYTINSSENSYTFTTKGKEVYILQLAFDYEYICYRTSIGKGYITIETDDYTLSKTFQFGKETDTTHVLQNITASIVTNWKGVTGYRLEGQNADDSSVQALGLQALKRVLNDAKIKEISGFITSVYNKYYENENNYVINVDTNFPKKSMGIDIGYGHEPKVLSDGLVFYHDGGVVDYSSRSLPRSQLLLKQANEVSRLRNLGKPPYYVWDKFQQEDGTFQIFISKFMIEDAFKHLSSQAKFTFKLDNKDLPSGFPFRLNVDTLGKIYPSLLNFLPSDLSLTISGYFDKFEFQLTKERIIGTSQMNIRFSAEGISGFIFSTQALIEFELNYYIIDGDKDGVNEFNLIVDKPIRVNSLITPSQYDNYSYPKLLSSITESVNFFLKRRFWVFFEKGVDIKGFKKLNGSRIIESEGILITGMHDSKNPQ